MHNLAPIVISQQFASILERLHSETEHFAGRHATLKTQKQAQVALECFLFREAIAGRPWFARNLRPLISTEGEALVVSFEGKTLAGRSFLRMYFSRD